MATVQAWIAGAAVLGLAALPGPVARGQATDEAAATAGVTSATGIVAEPEPGTREGGARRGPRINALQLLGTHNSYHLAPDQFALEAIAAVTPDEARAIDCSQRPLTDQLNVLGLRHFELDCYLDPDGGLFSDPLVLRLARAAGRDVGPFDPDGVLAAPGIKVLHSPDFDVRTTQYTLQGALAEIRAW